MNRVRGENVFEIEGDVLAGFLHLLPFMISRIMLSEGYMLYCIESDHQSWVSLLEFRKL